MLKRNLSTIYTKFFVFEDSNKISLCTVILKLKVLYKFEMNILQTRRIEIMKKKIKYDFNAFFVKL